MPPVARIFSDVFSDGVRFNQSANELETVFVPCTDTVLYEDVLWEFKRLIPGSLYDKIFSEHGYIMPDYADRFSVNTTYVANYALVIRSVKLTDAGLYKCTTKYGLEDSTVTSLTVRGKTLICKLSTSSVFTSIGMIGYYPESSLNS